MKWNESVVGLKFGNVTVEKILPSVKSRARVQAKCKCGKIINCYAWTLNESRSCGCLTVKQYKHGLTGTDTYSTWNQMKQRCCNPSHPAYPFYGGRGIRICKSWLNSVARFSKDLGPIPAGSSLDRINNDGDYCPSNCRWATSSQQARNKRNNVWLTFEGKTMCIADMAKFYGIPYQRLRSRLERGWTIERAILEKVQKKESQ